MKVTFKVMDERGQFYAKRAISELPLNKTWVVEIKPEARTEQLKQVIKMAYEEGYEACSEAEGN